MNNNRRELLKNAANLLDKVLSIVNDTLDQEQECLDNMPENLQCSEHYERMEIRVECLEEAISDMENAKIRIDEAAS